MVPPTQLDSRRILGTMVNISTIFYLQAKKGKRIPKVKAIIHDFLRLWCSVAKSVETLSDASRGHIMPFGNIYDHYMLS